MDDTRPSHFVIALEAVVLCAAILVAIIAAPSADWDPWSLIVLTLFGGISALTAPTAWRLHISGSFLAIVVGMVFLGGAPAAVIGVVAMCIAWPNGRVAFHYFFNNLVTYAVFPLAGGIAFHAASTALGLTADDVTFYLLILALFAVTLVVNFAMTVGYSSYIERRSLWSDFRRMFVPMLPSELVAAVLALLVSYTYHRVGVGALALLGFVLIVFQHLTGALLVSEQRAAELEHRTKQLASFQVGMLSALLRTLDLRDRMTARHSAAVARYARAIAARAGMSRGEEELVHTAGLLHDIGKVILPDHILKANVPLTEDDWKLIRRHPAQGARVVASVDGYGPVADIILAHHERIDGKGYPRRLKGDEIPEAARIIAVADTYDVMTARDSYREPRSSFEAIQELQRVAGTQLDPRFVNIFVELLEGKDLDFRHGVDADFEKELSLEARIERVAQPGGREDPLTGLLP